METGGLNQAVGIVRNSLCDQQGFCLSTLRWAMHMDRCFMAHQGKQHRGSPPDRAAPGPIQALFAFFPCVQERNFFSSYTEKKNMLFKFYCYLGWYSKQTQ